MACIVYVPVDVIKERLQVQHRHAPPAASTTTAATTINDFNHQPYYKNGTDALFKILRQEGWYGIYRGYGATLASECVRQSGSRSTDDTAPSTESSILWSENLLTIRLIVFAAHFPH